MTEQLEHVSVVCWGPRGSIKVIKDVVLGCFSCRGFRLLDQIYITYQQCEHQSAKYPFWGPHWCYESH